MSHQTQNSSTRSVVCAFLHKKKIITVIKIKLTKYKQRKKEQSLYSYCDLNSSSLIKLGMSFTGRLLVWALTLKFLSSVSNTTLSLSPVCVGGEGG